MTVKELMWEYSKYLNHRYRNQPLSLTQKTVEEFFDYLDIEQGKGIDKDRTIIT